MSTQGSIKRDDLRQVDLRVDAVEVHQTTGRPKSVMPAVDDYVNININPSTPGKRIVAAREAGFLPTGKGNAR